MSRFTVYAETGDFKDVDAWNERDAVRRVMAITNGRCGAIYRILKQQ